MIEIRQTGYDHPDAIALTDLAQAFYIQLYGGPDRAPSEVAEFAPPNGAFLVGYLDDEPVVMGGWRFVKAAVAGAQRPAEVKRMFVRSDRRRLGLARQMLTALEVSAKAAGADWIVLETGAPQVEALALYRASGYIEVDRFGFYADYPNARTLGKQLTPPVAFTP